ncbi:Type II/III secretion system domain-containing protein [Desulfonema limicola]|uniref:Type II/III secretion system domain-containing protein n=1 Tax=Desulfonema limicola TaxID=45656 RepID=A0A975B8H0_9BACT|nr:secretin N-terminal domain-containing protein [Desulfonema limicola]QTA80612.1 Type II/III secretion system domain-containing protein [Desulfonema limicola]
MSSDPGLFDRLSSFISQIDQASDEAEPQIYVYSVKNGGAEELSQLLNTVFTGRTAEDQENTVKQAENEPGTALKTASPNPFGDKKKTEVKTASVMKSSVKGSDFNNGSNTLKGDVKIIPDIVRNSLIIEAIPSDYKIIIDILKQTDVLPRQVLIEATIAEITLDNSTSLGVGWSFSKTGDGDTGLLTANIGEQGLSYTIGLTEKWTHAISALASKKKVNILSSPVILASDNKEAQINVSTKIPIPTTEYQYETDSQPIFQTSIQYRDTGLILSVTPHINERGLVSMDISQEISEEGAGIEVGGKNYSTFRERLVKTTLTVKDGQTIVLGGLMEETKDDGGSGVPFLSDLPVIGYLFGKKSNSFIKKELIILLTPRVIITQDDVDIVTEEFKRKVSNLKEKLDLLY